MRGGRGLVTVMGRCGQELWRHRWRSFKQERGWCSATTLSYVGLLVRSGKHENHPGDPGTQRLHLVCLLGPTL
jgi:hypothetical protein